MGTPLFTQINSSGGVVLLPVEKEVSFYDLKMEELKNLVMAMPTSLPVQDDPRAQKTGTPRQVVVTSRNPILDPLQRFGNPTTCAT